jgi:hypothetical protein
MTALTTDSQAWLWDFERHKARVRHWPAITQGLVHVHDITDLAPLRRQAAQAESADAWLNTWAQTLPSTDMLVAVDSLAEMLDQNREQCLGEASALKGYSESVFALARAEVLDQLPFPARLALLAEGLAIIEEHPTGADVRAALSELTVNDLQKLAEEVPDLPSRLKKGELITALTEAAEAGQINLPLGAISASPNLKPWLQERVDWYVQALKDGLRHPVYPRAFREAVWRQALEQVTIEPLRQAIEVAYWQVLERDIEDLDANTNNTPSADTNSEKPTSLSTPWRPGLSRKNQDLPWIWLGVIGLFALWLWW